MILSFLPIDICAKGFEAILDQWMQIQICEMEFQPPLGDACYVQQIIDKSRL